MPGCPSCGAAGQRAVIKATFAMSAVQHQPAAGSTCSLGLNIYASHHALRMHASAADRVADRLCYGVPMTRRTEDRGNRATVTATRVQDS
jgi:hypothetical protein